MRLLRHKRGNPETDYVEAYPTTPPPRLYSYPGYTLMAWRETKGSINGIKLIPDCLWSKAGADLTGTLGTGSSEGVSFPPCRNTTTNMAGTHWHVVLQLHHWDQARIHPHPTSPPHAVLPAPR